jgi:DNA replication protein DnaC
MNQAVDQLLKTLHLPGIRASYEQIGQQAITDHSSYDDYLMNLLEEETHIRQQNRITRYLKESRLPYEKTIDVFDRSRLDQKTDRLVSVLVKGAFTDKYENVLAFGSPGSGKTHLLCAIGHELILQGKRVIFYPSALLIQELLQVKRELLLPKYLKRLDKFDAIIIDDIGYVQQDKYEMEVLFTLLADKYEKTSIMISSNLPFSGWEKIFKDPMITAAAIDRLVHHCVILEMNMKSYRLENATKNQEKRV